MARSSSLRFCQDEGISSGLATASSASNVVSLAEVPTRLRLTSDWTCIWFWVRLGEGAQKMSDWYYWQRASGCHWSNDKVTCILCDLEYGLRYRRSYSVATVFVLIFPVSLEFFCLLQKYLHCTSLSLNRRNKRYNYPTTMFVETEILLIFAICPATRCSASIRQLFYSIDASISFFSFFDSRHFFPSAIRESLRGLSSDWFVCWPLVEGRSGCGTEAEVFSF